MKTLTTNELAKRVGVHPDTIRKYDQAGYICSMRTLGGHRRYLEAEVDHLIHNMKCPPLSYFLTLEGEAWCRKDRFIYWKRFVGFHRCNEANKENPAEIHKREGSEMVLDALDNLRDEDWKSVDKIDEALEPIYQWYRENNKLYFESVLCNKPKPISPEQEIIGQQLSGIDHVLWWGIRCLAGDGKESALSGKGSFPHEREQMELDRKNGWDGRGDFTQQREKLIQEGLARRLEERCR